MVTLQVRGYLPQYQELVADAADIGMMQQALIDLAQKKQELIYELSRYQASGSSGAGASNGTAALNSGISSMVPPDTRVDSCIALNKSNLNCELILRTNNETVIRAAIIFGEQVGCWVVL